jgi:hexokinase
MNQLVSAFLAKHNFPVYMNIGAVVNALLDDMNSGLGVNSKKGSGKCTLRAGEDMIRTWCMPPAKQPKKKSVIVIDAGGTNFRSCLVTFADDGVPSISDMQKTVMPGVAKELSKKEFFDQIAQNLEHLKDKSDRIGFCFSYAMEITKDGDGIPKSFSKEVKAPEVVGCRVGKELASALKAHGWKKIKKITLCNDTVAALLAGAAGTPEGVRYSSYIGFILGTGLNAAYIQPPVKGVKGLEKEQIVVCESGKFDKIVRSDFDIELDKKTVHPGLYLTEKCCSGAYLGHVVCEVLRSAALDGIVSAPCAKALRALTDGDDASSPKISLIDVDSFMYAPYKKETAICSVCASWASEEDYTVVYELVDAVIERCSRYAAAILGAAVIQSGKGTHPAEPACILCNGTTFFKTHHLRTYVEEFLDELLIRERGLYYEIVTKENDITLGAAVAGLTD